MFEASRSPVGYPDNATCLNIVSPLFSFVPIDIITGFICNRRPTATMAAGGLKLRSPYPPPSHPDPIVLSLDLRLIKFRHPSYPDHSNTLFAFTANDDDGVHHETARLACAVVAGNRWDGFFCEDMDGQRRSIGGPDEILRALNYYFHLPGASNGV